MTNRSLPDPIDPYESRLARRVGSFSDQAVLPIDPVSIAASAGAARRRSTWRRSLAPAGGLAGRLALVGAVALLGAGALAITFSGGSNPPNDATASQEPSAAATSPGDVLAYCSSDSLLSILSWDGAAGSRIATVEARNDGAVACVLPMLLRVDFVDGAGRVLIAGGPTADRIVEKTLEPGRYARTMVQVSNYCGPDPVGPATIRFTFPSDRYLDAAPLAGSSGEEVPPCNGPGSPGSIEMQPFQF